MKIRTRALIVLLALFGVPIAAAYAQWILFGLPKVSIGPPLPESARGFPAWLRIAHYVNFLFLTLLIRSGLQILMDHPRLYWNVHCTPGTEWLRLTPIEVPRDRVWTSKDDARHLSPWLGLPGYRHTVGMARHWHFLSVMFWTANGLIFALLLFGSGQWRRLVPTSWSILPEAWAVFVNYATFHLPPEPDVQDRFNALQQLSYFAAIFILAPLAMLTGPSMSPALTNRFRWYPKLPGNRQVGRSIHFLIMAAFILFVIGHVTMVVVTGLAKNMNYIVLGRDGEGALGWILGLAAIALVVALNGMANWAAWRFPREIQHLARAMVRPIQEALLDRVEPQAEFRPEDVSPFFWPNGKTPTREDWKDLAANDFRDYRLKVFGLVENPVELSLDDLRAMEKRTQITLHHCIQGWSGIAEWGGATMAEVIALVRPAPNARLGVFYSFGEGLEGGRYYDSHSIENLMHSQSLLAYEMNGRPLPTLHGAPLRLRVENQLGFKMVKWVESIEFVESYRGIGEGEGGFNEDREYFGELANI